jgi:hypothetical protein
VCFVLYHTLLLLLPHSTQQSLALVQLAGAAASIGNGEAPGQVAAGAGSSSSSMVRTTNNYMTAHMVQLLQAWLSSSSAAATGVGNVRQQIHVPTLAAAVTVPTAATNRHTAAPGYWTDVAPRQQLARHQDCTLDFIAAGSSSSIGQGQQRLGWHAPLLPRVVAEQSSYKVAPRHQSLMARHPASIFASSSSSSTMPPMLTGCLTPPAAAVTVPVLDVFGGATAAELSAPSSPARHSADRLFSGLEPVNASNNSNGSALRLWNSTSSSSSSSSSSFGPWRQAFGESLSVPVLAPLQRTVQSVSALQAHTAVAQLAAATCSTTSTSEVHTALYGPTLEGSFGKNPCAKVRCSPPAASWITELFAVRELRRSSVMALSLKVNAALLPLT